jgi:hypothetical protein
MLAKADKQRYNTMVTLQRFRGRLGVARHLSGLRRHHGHSGRARTTAD